MIVDRLFCGIEPVRSADVECQVTRWLHILDAERENDRIATGSAFYFAYDLSRFVRLTTEKENEDATFVDGINDRGPVVFSRSDIARRNPAGHAVLFKIGAQPFRDRQISGGMTDEDDPFHQRQTGGITFRSI